MRKKFRIIGAIALVITLVCNLQYALFDYDVNNGAALASWTDSSGNRYCGSAPNTTWKAGHWFFHEPDAAHNPPNAYGYENGYYIFRTDNSGTDCGLWHLAETNITPTHVTY